MKILFSLTGTVQHSTGRGKKLGYPTANIPPTNDIKDGLYVGLARLDAEKHPALIFIGPAITFGETERKAGIYMLDFKEDLYDKEIHVDILQKQRDNIKFESSEELIAQMQKDEKAAKEFFRERSL